MDYIVPALIHEWNISTSPGGKVLNTRRSYSISSAPFHQCTTRRGDTHNACHNLANVPTSIFVPQG